MSDFTSPFWHYYTAAIVIGGIVFMVWLVKSQSVRRTDPGKKAEVTGHKWDEDLEELNNPLPRWWIIFFYITIVFAVGYLALFPGLGAFQGWLGWSQVKQYEQEMAEANARYNPIFEKYLTQDIAAVAADPDAVRRGQNLFLNYCAQCHGADARGSKGFPNLADHDWLYGGEPAAIKHSIMQGRQGMMPAIGKGFDAETLDNVTQYVLSLSGRPHDSAKAAGGKTTFSTSCAMCHGPGGEGNPFIGSANLTDKIWLHGSSVESIQDVITNGRQSRMPAWRDMLGEGKIHVLAAYVYSLSADGRKPATAPEPQPETAAAESPAEESSGG
jgi:cytochrome c oxidase cbb3-type subunit 3